MLRISEVALRAHCRRVAGWATQCAEKLDCSGEELQALEDAALWHHWPAILLRFEAVARVASDLQVQIGGKDAPIPFSERCLRILQSFHGLMTDSRAAELGRILEQADQFDEQFELDSIDPLPPELSSESLTEALHLQLVNASAVLRAGENLPVFPTVAQRAMRLLAMEDVSFEHVEQLLRADQVLAAEMLKVANSALSSPRQPISTLNRAIAHIGIDAAIRVICASCMRPVFASRNLFDLWNHSLEAAGIAEGIALKSGRVDPGEAFLAGLIHDIGRLAFSLLSCAYQDQAQRLSEYGCPPLLVEQALTGTTHAQVGAELVSAWGIPSEIADAVRLHHHPDRDGGPLAATLYLTEFWTGREEDLPSRARLETAIRVAGLPTDSFHVTAPPVSPSLRHFRNAAAG